MRQLDSDTIPDTLLEIDEIRDAAIKGITNHLFDSRGEGDIDTAIQIKDLFKIHHNEIDQDNIKQGIENWTMDKGPDFGQKICEAFNIPNEFMESNEIKLAKERFSRLNPQREGSKTII